MKFLEILDSYSKTLTEQDAAGVEGTDVAGVEGTDVSGGVENVADPCETDVPAGIATMGNLLKKALTMKINDSDRYKISQLPEINEKNAFNIFSLKFSIP